MDKVEEILQQILETRDGEVRNDIESLKAGYKACLEQLNLLENKMRQNEENINTITQNSFSVDRIIQMEIIINELAFLQRRQQLGRRV